MLYRLFLFFLLIAALMHSCANRSGNTLPNPPLAEPPLIELDSIFIMPDLEHIQAKASQVDELFQRLRRLTGFNGTVLYAEKGRIVYRDAFGFENVIRRRDSLQVDSRFELASVSKMFTAMAIMLLHEEGKIVSYDDDVHNYIQEWPYNDVKIRQLLHHRSGLPRYESLAHDEWADKTIPLTNDRMIELFIKHKPSPYFRPDRGFHYCNTNYALLASVVERASGMNFEDFMHERIFTPLGMNNSMIYSMRYDTAVPVYIDEIVPGHDLRGRRFIRVRNDYLNGVMGDKGMFSTVDDLYRFDKGLTHNLLLSESLLKEAFSPGSPPHRRRVDNYGFGWRIRTEADSAVYHYGWWKGFRSFYLRDMAQQKTLIVLTNTDRGPGADHFWSLINNEDVELSPASVNINFEMDNKLW
jgi:CubicO group peptidase (beta-lactamase class C family)